MSASTKAVVDVTHSGVTVLAKTARQGLKFLRGAALCAPSTFPGRAAERARRGALGGVCGRLLEDGSQEVEPLDERRLARHVRAQPDGGVRRNLSTSEGLGI